MLATSNGMQSQGKKPNHTQVVTCGYLHTDTCKQLLCELPHVQTARCSGKHLYTRLPVTRKLRQAKYVI